MISLQACLSLKSIFSIFYKHQLVHRNDLLSYSFLTAEFTFRVLVPPASPFIVHKYNSIHKQTCSFKKDINENMRWVNMHLRTGIHLAHRKLTS
jgi:hypothetical protein